MFRFRHLDSAPIEDEAVYRYCIHPDWLARKESWEIENFVAQEFKTDNEIALTGKMQWSDLGVVDFYMWLAYTSGLGLNAYLPVTVEDSGEIDLPFDQISQPSEDGISIFDVLGTYNPQDHHVTMYTKLIETTAGELGVDYDVLYQVVLVHELAHAITHLAYDEEGEVWSWFSLAKVEAQELLAQLLPFFIFRKCAMQPHLDAMEALSHHQSHLYNKYKKFANASVDEVRLIVKEERERLSLRRTSDVPFQIDFESWSTWMEEVTHIFQDGRALKNYSFRRMGIGSEPKDSPYKEGFFTDENFERLPNLVPEPTLKQLKELGRHIMSLDEEEFYTMPVQALDETTTTIKITLDGFTRAFIAQEIDSQPWGGKQLIFEKFLALNSQGIQEAEGHD